MADTTHNEVFDRLSQSFKESSLGQSSSIRSKSLLGTTQSTVGHQSLGKPDEKLLQFIRYKEWLDTVKRDYEAALEARKASSSAEDQDHLNERILKLQQELLKESTDHSLKELALKRLQLGDTLLQTFFPVNSPTSSQSTSDDLKDRLRELTSRQSELVSEIIGHHQVCQQVQEELDGVRKDCVEIKKKNRELMTDLLQKNEDNGREASSHDSVKHQQVHGEIERVLSHFQIGRNILQGLIVGSGVNWAADDDLKELMLNMGRSVDI